MIKVYTFTGESSMSQKDADRAAYLSLNDFLASNQKAAIMDNKIALSTTHTSTADVGDWHTCTIAAVFRMPESGQNNES